MMKKLRLSWTDPISQRSRHPLLSTPVALGSTFKSMPIEISGKSVSRMVIGDRQVQDFHALLVDIEGEIYLIDNLGQTYVNQQPVTGQARLNSGDRIRIGSTEIQFQIIAPPGYRPPSKQTTHLQAIPGGLNQPPQPFSPHANGRATTGRPTGRASNSPTSNTPTAADASSTGYPSIRNNNGNHGPTNRPMHIVPEPNQAPNASPNLPPYNAPQDPFTTHSQSNNPTVPGSTPQHHQPVPPSPMAPAGPNSATNNFPGQQRNGHLAPGQAHPGQGQNGAIPPAPGNNGYRSHGLINPPLPSQTQRPTPPPNQPHPQTHNHPQSPGRLAANPNEPAQRSRPMSNELPQSAPAAPQPRAVPQAPLLQPKGQGQAHHSTETGCRRIVGFLFKRPCGRLDSTGCSHCVNGYSSQAYAADYELYEGFGRYEPGDWGYGLLANQDQT